jgi:hypothetical protein
MSDPTTDVIDLDAARAARREAQTRQPRVRLNGVDYPLPVEFPIDVLTPLLGVGLDLGLVARLAADAVNADDPQAQRNAIGLVLDILVATPELPIQAIDAAQAITRNLLGQDGYDALVAMRPSREDLTILIGGVFRLYGVSLGEASPSADSSTSGGATSNETSSDTTESTPETSGEPVTTPA